MAIPFTDFCNVVVAVAAVVVASVVVVEEAYTQQHPNRGTVQSAYLRHSRHTPAPYAPTLLPIVALLVRICSSPYFLFLNAVAIESFFVCFFSLSALAMIQIY